MWIRFDDKELKLLKKALVRSKVYETEPNSTAASELLKRIEKQTDPDPIEALYRNAVETDDDLEVDDDAIVSPGADPGAWVHAWVWVSNEQAGFTEPEEDDDE